MKIDNKAARVKSWVKFLGLQFDADLNYTLHIANTCRYAANKVNALIRFRKFLGFEEKPIAS